MTEGEMKRLGIVRPQSFCHSLNPGCTVFLNLQDKEIPKDSGEFVCGAIELLEPDIVQILECKEFQWGEQSTTEVRTQTRDGIQGTICPSNRVLVHADLIKNIHICITEFISPNKLVQSLQLAPSHRRQTFLIIGRNLFSHYHQSDRRSVNLRSGFFRSLSKSRTARIRLQTSRAGFYSQNQVENTIYQASPGFL
jgi:hypothetical protein